MKAATRPALFTPLALRGTTLKNRVVVSPMCQYSATEGMAGDWHFAIDRSSGGIDPKAPLVARLPRGPAFQVPFADRVTGQAQAWQRTTDSFCGRHPVEPFYLVGQMESREHSKIAARTRNFWLRV